jgi:hypothetical protein
MKSNFRVPGVVWSALLVALPLLAIWLQDSFPAAVWAAPVAGLFLIVVKVVEVIAADAGAKMPPPGVDAASPEAQRPRRGRLLWG